MLSDKSKELPDSRDTFLGIPLSELKSLSCVPICVTCSPNRCKAGWTDCNKIWLNSNVNCEYRLHKA
jgi:hypothetical protein